MEPIPSNQHKSIGALLHLSVFTKYFIPLGNLIFPLVFWMVYRKDAFLGEHGKACLNFQISTTLYFVALAFIGFYGSLIFGVSLSGFEYLGSIDNIFQLSQFPGLFPFLIFIGIVLLLALVLFLLEIVCIIRAAVKASEGKAYSYPITIPFIGSRKQGAGSGKNATSQPSNSQLPSSNLNTQTP